MPEQQLLLPQRPLILGIAGPSGSGKTMLARELARQLGAQLLPLDAYYRDLPQLTPADRARENFDHPDSLEIPLLLHHLDELIAGRAIDRPVYDFATHSRVPNRTDHLPPAPVLLVEGILALHYPELRQRFDLGIFVHTPAAVCLARRIHRDVQQRGRTEAAVREQFHTTTQPMAEQFVLPSAAFANVTVEGTESLDWSVAAILHALGRSLAGAKPSGSDQPPPHPAAPTASNPKAPPDQEHQPK